MTYYFQSKDRNVDLGTFAMFRAFNFSTSDSEIAEKVRRNCTKNPHLYWEVTPSQKAEVESLEPEQKPRVGRPPKVLRGMRTQIEAEGVSV